MIISIGIYAPYTVYQKTAVVKQAGKEVSQSLLEARNMALHGLENSGNNLDIGLVFDTTNNKLIYKWYPFQEDGTISTTSQVIKEKTLPAWIIIESIAWESNEREFLFRAISWEILYRPNINPLLIPIPIEISFMWDNSSLFRISLQYDPRSFITDY